jgi:putative transposase
MMCRLLGFSASGFYAWCKRPASKRAIEDAELLSRIAQIHERSRGTYGMPRVHAELAADGVFVGRKRVARLMRAAGIEGVSRRRKYQRGGRDKQQVAPDLVDRNFTATAPNQLWVADITYVPTHAG